MRSAGQLRIGRRAIGLEQRQDAAHAGDSRAQIGDERLSDLLQHIERARIAKAAHRDPPGERARRGELAAQPRGVPHARVERGAHDLHHRVRSRHVFDRHRLIAGIVEHDEAADRHRRAVLFASRERNDQLVGLRVHRRARAVAEPMGAGGVGKELDARRTGIAARLSPHAPHEQQIVAENGAPRAKERGGQRRLALAAVAEERQPLSVDDQGRRVQRLPALLHERERQHRAEQIGLEALDRRPIEQRAGDVPAVGRHDELEQIGPAQELRPVRMDEPAIPGALRSARLEAGRPIVHRVRRLERQRHVGLAVRRRRRSNGSGISLRIDRPYPAYVSPAMLMRLPVSACAAPASARPRPRRTSRSARAAPRATRRRQSCRARSDG